MGWTLVDWRRVEPRWVTPRLIRNILLKISFRLELERKREILKSYSRTNYEDTTISVDENRGSHARARIRLDLEQTFLQFHCPKEGRRAYATTDRVPDLVIIINPPDYALPPRFPLP